MLLVTYGLLLCRKGYLELNPSGFRNKSYRISIYLVTAGSIKISLSMVWTAFRFIIPWYCAWKEHDEFVQFTTYKSEACNTDTYVSLLLLHGVVRWKGLLDRVRVPCVMWRLPPGVEQGTKLGDVLCWDFALLVVMGCWLTGARPDFIPARVQFMVESGGRGMFASLALLIEDAKKWIPVSSRMSWTAKNS